jgi:hypothetical protein
MRLIGLFVILLEIGCLCFYAGYVSACHLATGAAKAAKSDRADAYQIARSREIAAGQVQRLGILKVDFVRYVDPRLADDPWAAVEFRVTNQTGKPIDEVDGGIRLYGPGHKYLATVGANIVEPLDVGGSATGRARWNKLVFYKTIRAALAEGTVSADFRADRVLYTDGAEQGFLYAEGGGRPFIASWPDSDMRDVSPDVR